METVSLIIALIDAIAWPVTILIVLYHLRQPLLSLVPQLSQLKVGSFEFNLAERTAELSEDTEELTARDEAALEEGNRTGVATKGPVSQPTNGSREKAAEDTAGGESVDEAVEEAAPAGAVREGGGSAKAESGVWARWDRISRVPMEEFADRVAQVDPAAVYHEGRRRLEALARTFYDVMVEPDPWIGDVRPKVSRLIGEGVLDQSTGDLFLRALELAKAGGHVGKDIPPDLIEYSARNFARTVSMITKQAFRELEKANDWGLNSNAEPWIRHST